MGGPDSINFGIGEPDFQPPPNAMAAMKKAAEDGKNKYGPINGIPALREAVARKLSTYDKNVTADNVVITVGASEGLRAAYGTFLDPGDEILIPDPGFPSYAQHAYLVEARPVTYSLKQENQFLPDLEALERLVTKKTKVLLLNSPSNPTGGMIPASLNARLREFALKHDLYIISDEVYDAIVYEEPHVSFLDVERCPKTLFLGSFSKTYAMTGWRLGFAAGSREVIEAFTKVHYYSVACPPTPLQFGALEALTGPQDTLKHMQAKFASRRELIARRISKVPGFSLLKPKGAFYAFPSFAHQVSSWDMAVHLIKHKVVTIPGSSFGKMGQGYLRFSFATSEENIEEGMNRIEEGVKDLKL